MNKRDSYASWRELAPVTSAGPLGAGVLHAEAAATRFTLRRHPPPEDLAPFVDFCWVIRWDLRGQPTHDQQILPHPNVNLAFEASGAAVFGVDRRIFSRRLAGAGKALGIRFRPGGFRPYSPKPIFSLNDRVVPAASLLGPAADKACTVVMAADADDDAMIAAAAGVLRGFGAAPDPLVEQAARLVKLITDDPGLRRVSQLAAASGLSQRRLQRLFADYVGVLAPFSIRVNTVHPTGVNTPMIVNDVMAEFLAHDPQLSNAVANALPVDMVEAVDISNAILWLVSDDARYVTSVTLPADAGFTNKK